jgi:hypothetical protein
LTNPALDYPDFEGKKSLNKVFQGTSIGADILVTFSEVSETDFSNQEEKTVFTQNLIQTIGGNTPVIGPGVDAILIDSRAEDGLTNLENSRMSDAYSSGITPTRNMAAQRILQRQQAIERRTAQND